MAKNYDKTEEKNMLNAIQQGSSEAMSDYVRKQINDAGPYAAALPMAGAGPMFSSMIQGAAPTVAKIMAHPVTETVGFADGIRNLLTDNGVQKTIRLTKEGDY
jgi:hypothetical protein